MGRPALILAALAADAAPGKNFRHYVKVTDNPDIETLRLWDQDSNSYELKIPATGSGVTELATELMVLKSLRSLASLLPFEVPAQIGQTQDSDGSKAVVFTLLGGSNPDLSRFGPGPFSKSFGEAIAALHNLPTASFVDAGLPTYDSTSLLHNRVRDLDRMAATGRVPAALLTRWESALEDVGLFRFHPSVTHGAISSESVLIENQGIVGITSWNQLSVSDPAEDFRWLAGGALPSTFEDALIHYRASRPNADENFAQRAVLYSELELGSWLLHCLETGDQEQIKQAEDLLIDLRDNLEAGNLKDLTATSFVGLAAAAAVIPEVQPPQMGDEISEPEDSIEDEAEFTFPDDDSPKGGHESETSLDELF